MWLRDTPPGDLRRLLILASALVFLDVLFFSVLAPLLPSYVANLGLSKAQAGVLTAAYATGALVAALPAGSLAGRFGPRRVVNAGLATLALSSILLGWSKDIVVLDAARFIQGAGGSLIWGAALTWLISGAPPERKGTVLGAAIGAGTAGALLGPAIGGVAAGLGTGPVFSMIALVSVILIWAASQLDDAQLLDPQSVRDVRSAITTRPVLDGIAFDAILALSFGILAVLVPLRMNALGAGAGVIAAVFIGGAMIEAVLAPIAGRWSDRVGGRSPYILGLLLCGFALAVIAAADSLTVLIIAVLGTSLGGGISLTPAFTILSDAASRGGIHQGIAVALSNLSWSLGQAVGALGGGALAALGGNALPLMGMVAILSATAIYARLALPPAARSPAPRQT